MDCTLHVSWDDRLVAYDFGPQHPLAPIRVKLTMELATALGVLAGETVTVASAAPAADAELQLVHDASYIETVRYAGGLAANDGNGPADVTRLLKAGLGTSDDPVFAHMHEASALVAGATLAAARAMWSGTVRHGANIEGGLHHAMRGNASEIGRAHV